MRMKIMTKLRLFIFVLVVVPSVSAFSQLNEELREEVVARTTAKELNWLNIADRYFNEKEFLMAIPYYDSLVSKYPENLYLSYLLGVCEVYDAQSQKGAEKLIKRAEPIKGKLFDYDFYLGKAYLDNDKYDAAIVQFGMYLTNPLDKELKEEVTRQISICKNAKESNEKFSAAKITSLGTPINTKGSEYCPIFPSDERFMVFTYCGEKSKGGKQSLPGKKDPKNGIYFEDVFISYKGPRGEWSEPLSIDAINTNGHDAAIYISQDGQRLFIYRNTSSGNGDIYESRQVGSSWSKPEKVKGINSNAWEGSVCLSPDQSIIYFSSERPGGMGGRDIYFAQLKPDGTWGDVKNLGPEINTKFDEDAPFVHSDGKTLFFASNGHNTIGGYDIFKSELKSGKWDKPFNVGKPVNTVGDDKFYVVSSDGRRGYYSSEKKEGMGQQDIYYVEPGMFGKPTALVLVKGKVTFNDKPVEAKIQVVSKLYKTEYASNLKSNSETGRYLINLPSGNEFDIMFSYNNISQTRSLSTALIDSFARLDIDGYLFTEEYLESKMPKTVDSTQLRSDEIAKVEMTYQEFLEKFGNSTADSLDFRIQIGAYKDINKFNYSKIIGLPSVLRRTYHDGITRFTIGAYKTLNEANAICNKARKNGLKDAFVIAIYRDERVNWTKLRDEQILKTN